MVVRSRSADKMGLLQDRVTYSSHAVLYVGLVRMTISRSYGCFHLGFSHFTGEVIMSSDKVAGAQWSRVGVEEDIEDTTKIC